MHDTTILNLTVDPVQMAMSLAASEAPDEQYQTVMRKVLPEWDDLSDDARTMVVNCSRRTAEAELKAQSLTEMVLSLTEPGQVWEQGVHETGYVEYWRDDDLTLWVRRVL